MGDRMPTQQHRIVIIGAGFAGLLTARLLRERRPQDIDVTVVDSTDHFLFTPRLIDALGSTRDLRDRYTVPLADCAARFGFTFVLGLASHIDRTNRVVQVATEESITPLPYDLLVLTPGGKTAFYGIPGCEDCSVWLKTWDDVKRVHDRIQECIARALASSSDEERRDALSFVIVGGGPSGIESAFSLRAFVNETLRGQKQLLPYISYTLLQGAPQILTGFPRRMVEGSMRELEQQGIAVRVGAAVAAVEPTAVRLTNGERVSAGMTLWAGGVEPNTLPMTPDVKHGAQGIVVDDTLRVEERIFAAGDAITFRQKQLIIPKNAQTAMQMAHTLAENIIRSLDKQNLKPFRYHGLGSILTLGNTGYINVGPFAFKFPWAIWLRDLFYKHRQRQIVD
jgi:NADH dehydrogenase